MSHDTARTESQPTRMWRGHRLPRRLYAVPKPPMRGARRSLTVLGVSVAATGLLLASGPPAFAKSDITMTVNRKTVRVGETVQFRGQFDDDAGIDGYQVCLYELVKQGPAKQFAPCVPLHGQNGGPLKRNSFLGYFTVTITAKAPGHVVVVPYVKVGSALVTYAYAQIPIVVTPSSAPVGNAPAPVGKTPTPVAEASAPVVSAPTPASNAAGSAPPRALTAASSPAGRHGLVTLIVGSVAAAVAVALLVLGYLRRGRRRSRSELDG